jgi:hypothetical protein
MVLRLKVTLLYVRYSAAEGLPLGRSIESVCRAYLEQSPPQNVTSADIDGFSRQAQR